MRDAQRLHLITGMLGWSWDWSPRNEISREHVITERLPLIANLYNLALDIEHDGTRAEALERIHTDLGAMTPARWLILRYWLRQHRAPAINLLDKACVEALDDWLDERLGLTPIDSCQGLSSLGSLLNGAMRGSTGSFGTAFIERSMRLAGWSPSGFMEVLIVYHLANMDDLAIAGEIWADATGWMTSDGKCPLVTAELACEKAQEAFTLLEAHKPDRVSSPAAR